MENQENLLGFPQVTPGQAIVEAFQKFLESRYLPRKKFRHPTV